MHNLVELLTNLNQIFGKNSVHIFVWNQNLRVRTGDALIDNEKFKNSGSVASIAQRMQFEFRVEKFPRTFHYVLLSFRQYPTMIHAISARFLDPLKI